jgi:hypothetical protein
MSSRVRGAPRTQTRAPKQNNQKFIETGGNHPRIFQQSDLDALCNSNFAKVSDALYIANNQTALSTVLDTLNGNSNIINSNELSSIDLGKTIRIGLRGGENDIVTFRLVKRTGTLATGGHPNEYPYVCYIVVQNKVTKQYHYGLYPGVLGCAPTRTEKKQYLNAIDFQPAIFTASELISALTPLTKVSESMYIAPNSSTLNTVLDSLNPWTNRPYIDEFTCLDMGKTIQIGLAKGENDLLTFRLVKRTSNVNDGGEPNSYNEVGHGIVPEYGYVVISNKLARTYHEALYVSILGSAPTATQVKPQTLLNSGYLPAIWKLETLQSVLADCVKVSDTFYLAKDKAQLASVCNNLDSGSSDGYAGSYDITTIDMGKTFRLGLADGANDILTFVLTRTTGTVATGGEPSSEPLDGYIVVSNKVGQDYQNDLYLCIFGTGPS